MNADLIFRYFPDLDESARDHFLKLGDIYRSWNLKLNLVSRTDIEHLYERHILHSLAVARFVRFKPTATVMDLGTGGGFPGIPLAIMFPGTPFVLVDSIAKKINAVRGIADEIGLQNVETRCSRAEQLKESFDFVVSRATAPLSDLFKWSAKNISKHSDHAIPNGIICLKGGNLDEEMKPFKKHVQVLPVSGYFPEPWFEEKKLVYLPVSFST